MTAAGAAREPAASPRAVFPLEQQRRQSSAAGAEPLSRSPSHHVADGRPGQAVSVPLGPCSSSNSNSTITATTTTTRSPGAADPSSVTPLSILRPPYSRYSTHYQQQYQHQHQHQHQRQRQHRHHQIHYSHHHQNQTHNGAENLKPSLPPSLLPSSPSSTSSSSPSPSSPTSPNSPSSPFSSSRLAAIHPPLPPPSISLPPLPTPAPAAGSGNPSSSSRQLQQFSAAPSSPPISCKSSSHHRHQHHQHHQHQDRRPNTPTSAASASASASASTPTPSYLLPAEPPSPHSLSLSLSTSLSLPATPSTPASARGRQGGRADSDFPTAPHALSPPLHPSNIAVVDFEPTSDLASAAAPASKPTGAPQNARLPRVSQQPVYPSEPSYLGLGGAPSLHSPPLPATAALSSHPIPVAADETPQQGYRFPSPFRSRTGAPPSPRRPLRIASARLWNPTNSTPRSTKTRKRRDSTPPAPAIPLQHPSLDTSADASEPLVGGAGNFPLLTLSEQRQSKHSPTTRASLQIERRGSHDNRVSLPRSVRASQEGSRSQLPSPISQDVEVFANHFAKEDKGKERAAAMSPETDQVRNSFARDLERGPDVLDPRASNVSAGDAIGSALSSNSSIMGEDVQPDVGEEWGPQHPCYPHLNPHVPVDSLEYLTTRIIRIRRDWLLQGDLAPTFSNLYPEILDPAGVSEQEFRRIIEKLNGELVPIFSPYSFRNIMDSFLGLVTGWLWEDLGLTAVKSRLNDLEKWIDRWNLEMEKTMSSDEGAVPPKIIPLRQTAYMMLDIQIPDPEIAPAPSSVGAGESRTALPMEPAPAMVA